MSKEWFETWFDTKYYHLLYRNRNEVEARQFIDALLRFLTPEPGSQFIDVACGKGRHSKYLNSLGYKVTGIDLSENSINEARLNSSDDDGIQFHQQDIREPFPEKNLDFAVNLFTSFGYFDSEEEHQLALNNMYDSLAAGGKMVLDYMNASEVLLSLKREEHREVDGVHFKIRRYIDDGSIIKEITVTDNDETHVFEERVKAFSKIDLESLIANSGFKICATFGSYNLEPHTEQSSRVVIIAEK
ncbi:MAG TPA: SAM-dependent methyltransferase [Flavobacteriales bacterium]|nr:SAM-dependent methyltransferase [Flavobacteriales bacterium]